MSPLKKLFESLRVLSRKSIAYQYIKLLVFIGRRIAKEKCKQIKKSGKYQNLKKLDILDKFNKVMV